MFFWAFSFSITTKFKKMFFSIEYKIFFLKLNFLRFFFVFSWIVFSMSFNTLLFATCLCPHILSDQKNLKFQFSKNIFFSNSSERNWIRLIFCIFFWFLSRYIFLLYFFRLAHFVVFLFYYENKVKSSW